MMKIKKIIFVSDKICAQNVPETVQWILREKWHSKAQKAILSERFAGAPCREREISQGVVVSMYYSSLWLEFLKKFHLPGGQVKNRIH